MCKNIRHTYYCEELFIVKHKTKHSCKSAILYQLSEDIMHSHCKFKYKYNTTVIPSVLDGGSKKILANMLSTKRIICSHQDDLAKPMAYNSYVMVNHSILCNCHLESDLTYLLKSLGSCTNQNPDTPLEFTINLAFFHYLKEIWNETAISVIPAGYTDNEYEFPIYL